MAIGWGVVGTGSHVTDWMAPAFSRAENTRLAAVCSRELPRAQEVAKQFGFARAYDSYDKMLADDSVDAVYVCTPNSMHAEQAIAAARAGKHVLVEKPMALKSDDAEAMVEVCGAAGVRLGVGFHLRHHPAHQEARRLVQEGLLGQPFVYDLRWVVASTRRAGWWQDPDMIGAYILAARGVHLMDFARFLSGLEPTAVTMMSDGQRADRPLEEKAVLTLRFGEGVFATLILARHAAGTQNGFAVYGTAGTVQATGTIGPNPTGTLSLVTGSADTEVSYHAKGPYQAEIEAFNRSIVNGTTPSASGLDGLRVVRITEAAIKSAWEGRTVEIPD